MIILKDEITDLLLNFWENHKSNLIAILLGGSSVSPFINNPHDIDIIIIWKTSADRRDNLPESKQLYKKIHQIDIKCNCLQHYMEQYNDVFKNIWTVYAYLYQYHCIIAGEPFVILNNFNILLHPDKAIETILYVKELMHNKKWFYHVLTTLYILENNSYELTTQQIQNINIVHDQQDQEKIEELYQWALQQIQE